MRSHERVVHRNLFALIFLSLAACTQSQAVFITATAVPPTPLFATATTMPTATAVPRETAVPPAATKQAPSTPTPMPTPNSCPENALVSDLELPDQTDLLRVLYTVNDQYWLWREASETAVPMPIFRENRLVVSPDGRNFAYLLNTNELEQELWVMSSDGRNERNLSSLATSDLLSSYPNEEQESIKIEVIYWWNDAQSIFLRLIAQPVLGGEAKEAIYLVNVNTGSSQLIASPGAYSFNFQLSPDNRHAAVLTADFAELHLINLAKNQIQLKLPAISPILTFSPDGRFLLLPAQNGATVVDTVELAQRAIPFPYRGISVPGGPANPPSFWIDAITGYFVISDNSDGPEFTLWQVNLAEGTAIPVGSYAGFALLATFSPDGRTLAFWEENGDGFRNLHLVDTATGADVIYDTDRYSLLFDHWLPDSTHFVYSYWDSGAFTQRYLQIGQIGELPNPQGIPLSGSDPQWVDSFRFLQFQEIPTDGTSQRAALCLQTLNGGLVLIGELSALPEGSLHYLFYLENP